MWLRVLGSAAGGGFPQWNCTCPPCSAVRDGSRPSTPRTQSSVAVSADYENWFLFNASPDVRTQIEAFPGLHPRAGRATPLRAVLLTDAELDHTLGLLLLREARAVELHCTEAVREVLCGGVGLLRTLERYCAVDWRPVVPGTEVPLGDGLRYRAFDVPSTKRNRFGPGTAPVVGYRITDERSGAALAYLPGVQELTDGVLAELAGCACVLVDGTCWRDEEMIELGLAAKTSRSMGHVPMDGPGGSVERLATLGVERTIYTHLNNTNPVLLEDAPERRIVAEHGIEIAADGMEVRV